MLVVCLSVSLSLCLCQHGLAIQSASAPPCAIGREAGRHNQKNTGSHAAPSRGRRVLAIADNLEALSSHRASIAAGFTLPIKNLAYIDSSTHWPNPYQRLLDFSRLVRNGDYSSHRAGMCQRHPGEDRIPSPDQQSSRASICSNKPGTKAVVPRVDTAPHGVETPTPLADC